MVVVLTIEGINVYIQNRPLPFALHLRKSTYILISAHTKAKMNGIRYLAANLAIALHPN
jgi:hypothetical protein